MQHLGKTKCCGHCFTANDIQGKLMSQQEALGTNDVHLYGGNAKRFANATCPTCDTKYIMWLKPEGGSYRVLTISKAPESEPEGDGLEFMNMLALRKMASEAGIKDYTKLKKMELVEQLKALQ